MEYYVGLVEADIDLRGGPDGVGRARGRVDSDPEVISVYVRSKAPGAIRIGLETGPTSTWLWTELKRLGLPVICIDARHAKAVLKCRSTRATATMLSGSRASCRRVGSRTCLSKDIDSHSVRALFDGREKCHTCPAAWSRDIS
jgi:transposase